MRYIVKRNSAPGARVFIGSKSKRAERHTVKSAHKRPNFTALFNLAGKLESRLNRICPRRTRKHNLVVQIARL